MLRRILLLFAFAVFVIAAVLGFGWFAEATAENEIGFVALGLACWIAATLP